MEDKGTRSGGNGLKRHLAESPSHQKKPAFHSWFKFLLLLSVMFLVLFLTVSRSSLSGLDAFTVYTTHYHSLFSQTNKKTPPPAYRVHPKLKVKPNEVHETTKPTPGPPTVPPTVPTTVPPTVPTTVPPTVPPTVPTTVPPTVPPTVPHTVPHALPSTVAPTGTLYHNAYPRNYRFVMNHAEVCRMKTPFLVLMVPVAPKNIEARDAIRQTWGKENLVQGEVVLTLFMLGIPAGADVDQQQEKVKQENLEHNDLIQSDFMDTYLNLTIKTMVIMDWLGTHCPTASYAMKIDSDMFLNIDNLVIMLKKPEIPKINYLTGMLMWNRPVIRTKTSKWYVSEEMYPDPRYPTYTLGMGYVFSNDLPVKFVEISKSIKPFNIEDAYIGMCMKKLGLAPTSPPNPSQFKAYNTNYNRCEYSKVITYILGSSVELVKYWTDLKKPGSPC